MPESLSRTRSSGVCRNWSDAPAWIQAEGGVIGSLWMFGAGETDLEIVARCKRDRDRLRELLAGWVRHNHTKRSRKDPPVDGCPRCDLEIEGVL